MTDKTTLEQIFSLDIYSWYYGAVLLGTRSTLFKFTQPFKRLALKNRAQEFFMLFGSWCSDRFMRQFTPPQLHFFKAPIVLLFVVVQALLLSEL